MKLKERGVDTRTFFIGMHKQPAYFDDDPRFPDTTGNYPCSDELETKGFYLPSPSHLTKEKITFIVDQIKEIREENKKGLIGEENANKL